MNDDFTVTSGRHTLAVSETTFCVVGDDCYDLTTLTGVAYTAVSHRLNGAYQGTDFRIQLRQDKRSRMFVLHTGHRDEQLAEFQDAYARLVEQIESVVVPRLADEAVAGLRQGESVSIGPSGAKVVCSPDGVKKGGLFGKPVPWVQVTGTDVDAQQIRVWGRKSSSSGDGTVIAQVGAAEWNARILPHVVTRMTAG